MTKQKRHTCIICKRKRVESKMLLLLLELNHWYCNDCKRHKDIVTLIRIHSLKKSLLNGHLQRLF